jgi:hypothetical protein
VCSRTRRRTRKTFICQWGAVLCVVLVPGTSYTDDTGTYEPQILPEDFAIKFADYEKKKKKRVTHTHNTAKQQENLATMKTVAATPVPMSAFKPASSEQVRSKFFNMIGIESKLPTVPPPLLMSGENASKGNSLPQQPGMEQGWTHPRTQKLNCVQEALKYDPVADRIYSPKRRKTTTPTKMSISPNTNSSPSASRKEKRLGFVDTVDVVPIPMRTEYSNRVRSRLWSNAIEIHENAARNTIEFAAEG